MTFKRIVLTTGVLGKPYPPPSIPWGIVWHKKTIQQSCTKVCFCIHNFSQTVPRVWIGQISNAKPYPGVIWLTYYIEQNYFTRGHLTSALERAGVLLKNTKITDHMVRRAKYIEQYSTQNKPITETIR